MCFYLSLAVSVSLCGYKDLFVLLVAPVILSLGVYLLALYILVFSYTEIHLDLPEHKKQQTSDLKQQGAARQYLSRPAIPVINL